MNILIAAATEGEIEPALRWLQTNAVQTGAGIFTLGHHAAHICITGVGIMVATASLARALGQEAYAFALQAGVAGSYSREIALGEVVRVTFEQLGDFGAEEKDGTFLDAFELGLVPKNEAPFVDNLIRFCGPAHPLIEPFESLRAVQGATVQTVSGTAATIGARTARFGAEIETMEGAPFQYCCATARPTVPFVQLRAISNYVEPRNRAAWKMKEAVAALNATLIEWLRRLLKSNGPTGDQVSL